MPNFQPAQKIINVLEEYLDSVEFLKKIKSLRQAMGIPLLGLPLEVKKEEVNSLDYFFYRPKGISLEKAKDINLQLTEITKDFPIHNFETTTGFKMFFYHNLYFKEVFRHAVWVENVCKIVYAHNDFIEYGADDPVSYSEYINGQIDLINTYPIALHIHPNASQRDVVEYVKKCWPLFEHSLKEFKDKKSMIGKIRNKKEYIKQRNSFIYENRHLSRKKIMELVGDKYGVNHIVDYAYIGKIISLENKRRKQV